MNALAEIFYIAYGIRIAAVPNIAVPTNGYVLRAANTDVRTL